MKPIGMWINALVAALVAVLAVSAQAAPPAKLALTGGRIIPVVGPEIEEGTILIENGRITAVGKDVEIPFDAMEVDVSGMVVFPGMVDPETTGGLDVPNENIPVSPFLDVADAIDPSSLFYESSLRSGITSVHVMPGNNCVIGGLSRIVRPIGLSIVEMSFRPGDALKLSATPKFGYDRMRQMQELREAFFALDQSIDKLAEKRYEDVQKEKNKNVNVPPSEARELGRDLIRDSDYDDKYLNLVRLRRGELQPWIYCGQAMDVGAAIRFAESEEMSDRVVFVLGEESHKAVAELKAAGRPVVLSPELFHRERDPMSGELEETFVPKVINDAGLLFALKPNPGGSLAERYLTYQAALCVRNGVPRQRALEAITINPAKIIGAGDLIGSIEPGKVANLVILSGDPLDFNTWVEHVYIDGIHAYDRAKDARLKELLRLTNEPDEKPEGGESDGAEDAGDEAGEAGDAGDAGAGDSGEAGGESSDAGGEGAGSSR